MTTLYILTSIKMPNSIFTLIKFLASNIFCRVKLFLRFLLKCKLFQVRSVVVLGRRHKKFPFPINSHFLYNWKFSTKSNILFHMRTGIWCASLLELPVPLEIWWYIVPQFMLCNWKLVKAKNLGKFVWFKAKNLLLMIYDLVAINMRNTNRQPPCYWDYGVTIGLVLPSSKLSVLLCFLTG